MSGLLLEKVLVFYITSLGFINIEDQGLKERTRTTFNGVENTKTNTLSLLDIIYSQLI
jgi:hypothetical protein